MTGPVRRSLDEPNGQNDAGIWLEYGARVNDALAWDRARTHIGLGEFGCFALQKI